MIGPRSIFQMNLFSSSFSIDLFLVSGVKEKRGCALPPVLLFPGNGGEGRDEENERERRFFSGCFRRNLFLCLFIRSGSQIFLSHSFLNFTAYANARSPRTTMTIPRTRTSMLSPLDSSAGAATYDETL